MNPVTQDELQRTLGALVVVLTNHLPPNVSQSMAHHLKSMGDQMLDAGDTTAGTITKSLADATLARPEKH